MPRIELDFSAPERVETPALVTWIFQQKQPLPSDLKALDRKQDGRLQELVKAGEITGKAGEAVLLHRPTGFRARRLLLLGAGQAKSFSPAQHIRSLAGTAQRFLMGKGITEFAVWLPKSQADLDAVESVVEGVLLGAFNTAPYRTGEAAREVKPLKSVTITGLDNRKRSAAEKIAARGETIAEAQNFTRELANEPSNRMTPRLFAERVTQAGRKAGVKVQVLDEKQIRKLKMGALLSVAQGSAEPPRVVIMRYSHPKAGRKSPVLGLVGKGVTFDTGGISIKPSSGMEQMKYDMTGGATMAGAMLALGRLKPKCKVIAVIPLTENMPGGKAQKPGDIQFAMSGKSIEVINTDAEGRLILADGLHYARQLGATHLIDTATLTGAVSVALGHVNVGAFTNNAAFLKKLLASAKVAGEKIWELPMDDEYRDNIKSAIADIQNVGKGRGAGATNGAMFLKEFVDEETPWVHLDIAGTAWLESAKPWMPAGPTGVAVRTIIHMAENFGG